VGRGLDKIPHPPMKSKRGILLGFVLVAGFGSIVTIGGTEAIAFSETPGFCGMCHTMDPELKAYDMSPHKEVTCAECHINPGLTGFLKAKINGTKQLYGVVTGQFPTPIPPPDHADLPSTKVTCLKCHDIDDLTANGGPVKLVLRPRYQLNEANTQETVAVMLRPGGLGDASGVLGVHWHVEQDVTYTSGDIRARKIDLVTITDKKGQKKEYVSGSQVTVSSNAAADIARLKSSQTTRTMDCVDCHNRVGHGVPSPERAVDEAISSGTISSALPFIKRDSVALLNGDYPTLEAADKAIDGLRSTYSGHYPLVYKANEAKVTEAIDVLKTQYRLIATPAMKVQAKTYPDNLGHQTSLGCFRCHDGAHFLVVKGAVTTETIPSACATCHTFPQVTGNVAKYPLADKPTTSSMASVIASIPLGAKPADHKDKSYVFSHKNATKSVEPTGTSCAACHTPSYCENCHNSGAINVDHDKMLYGHAESARAAGGTQSCAYCHQAVSCAQCHKGRAVLGAGAPAAVIKVTQTP
jgi:nitrate/TMAO reductase-like tetraheme cytochrome c subunit